VLAITGVQRYSLLDSPPVAVPLVDYASGGAVGELMLALFRAAMCSK
jgi:hypothetical protein